MGGAGLFLIVIAFLFLYFVLVRPQKRRQLDQQRMLNEIKVGDEVVTAGGIYGTITQVLDDDDVLVRIAPQLEVKVARRAIGGVVHPEPDEPEAEEAPAEAEEPTTPPGE